MVSGLHGLPGLWRAFPKTAQQLALALALQPAVDPHVLAAPRVKHAPSQLAQRAVKSMLLGRSGVRGRHGPPPVEQANLHARVSATILQTQIFVAMAPRALDCPSTLRFATNSEQSMETGPPGLPGTKLAVLS